MVHLPGGVASLAVVLNLRPIKVVDLEQECTVTSLTFHQNLIEPAGDSLADCYVRERVRAGLEEDVLAAVAVIGVAWHRPHLVMGLVSQTVALVRPPKEGFAFSVVSRCDNISSGIN